MQERAVYDDVVREVRDELRQRVDAVTAAGVDRSAIIVDPGIGFAKLPRHNWTILARLREISCLGGESPFPVLVGASRKSFLGSLLPAADGEPRPAAQRDDATVAVSALAAVSGAQADEPRDVAALGRLRRHGRVGTAVRGAAFRRWPDRFLRRAGPGVRAHRAGRRADTGDYRSRPGPRGPPTRHHHWGG